VKSSSRVAVTLEGRTDSGAGQIASSCQTQPGLVSGGKVNSFQQEIGRDLDRFFQGSVDGAIAGVPKMHPLDGFPIFGVRLNPVADVDPPDDQNFVLSLNLPSDFRGKPAIAGVDPARLQRASQGAGQSAACGGNHVV